MLISDLVAALTDISREMGDVDIGFHVNGVMVTDMAHLNVKVQHAPGPSHEVPRPSTTPKETSHAA